MVDRRTGALLVLAAAVLWGTTGTAQALAPAGASPLSVGTLRLVIGGAALLSFARLRHLLPPLRDWPRRQTFFAALMIALYQLCFFAAVYRTGVVVGTIVGIGSAPVMAGLLLWWLEGELPGRRWMVATVLAIVGCSLLVAARGEVQLDLLGLLLALGAGASYTLYTRWSKDLIEHFPPDAVMAVLFGLGALLLLPLLLISDLRWLGQSGGIAVALHLGLIATALAYILFGRGLRLITPARAVTLSLAEPLTAGLLGLVVVGETLSISAAFGLILLIGSLLWLALA